MYGNSDIAGSDFGQTAGYYSPCVRGFLFLRDVPVRQIPLGSQYLFFLPPPFVILLNESDPASHHPIFLLGTLYIYPQLSRTTLRIPVNVAKYQFWFLRILVPKKLSNNILCADLGDPGDPTTLPSRSRSGGNALGSQFHFLRRGLNKWVLGGQGDVAIWELTPEKEPY
jgi:hypothetical protein